MSATEVRVTVEEALKVVRAAGYVAVKEKSYRAAQERQRRAECYREAAEDAAESARAWARDCLEEQRRLADRLTLVYGEARARGAAIDDLCAPGSEAQED